MERILVFILLRETNPSVLRASFPRHTHICFASQFEPPPRQRKKSETTTTTTKVVFHMRLRFLGDQPPHPFFLDDVSRVLSLKLSCVRVFLLTKECCVRIGNVVDDDARTTTSIKEDLTDETTTRDTIDVCSRVIETIVRGSVRYELDGDALRKELERMGLPKVFNKRFFFFFFFSKNCILTDFYHAGTRGRDRTTVRGECGSDEKSDAEESDSNRER